MDAQGDGLRPAEVLVLRPDLVDLYGLDARWQWRRLGGMEEFFQAIGEAAKAAAPIDFEAFVDNRLGNGRSGEKEAQIFAQAGAERIFGKRNVAALNDFDGAFEQELFEIGP